MKLDEGRLQEIRSWLARCRPMPERCETIPYRRRFSAEEVQALAYGFLPASMDDRWVVVMREGCVDFYRSWTGIHVYRVFLRAGEDGAEAEEILANRDLREHGNTDPAKDVRLVDDLLSCSFPGGGQRSSREHRGDARRSRRKSTSRHLRAAAAVRRQKDGLRSRRARLRQRVSRNALAFGSVVR